MTGAEHYREAEKLLHIAAETSSTKLAADAQQAAQVHATLALAAALLYPTPGQVAAAMPVTNVNHGGGLGIQAGTVHGGVRF